MTPHGAVIWLLAGATWAVVLIPLALWRRRRRDRAVCITDAQPPQPARPELDEYTGDTPSPGSAWAVGPPLDEHGGR